MACCTETHVDAMTPMRCARPYDPYIPRLCKSVVLVSDARPLLRTRLQDSGVCNSSTLASAKGEVRTAAVCR